MTNSLYALLKHHKMESHDFQSVFLAGCNHSFQISGLRSIVGWCVVHVDGIVSVVFYSFSQVSQLRVTLLLVLFVNGMQK